MPAIASSTIQFHIAIRGGNPSEWQFLLLQRSATTQRYPGLWQVITGGIREGETALQAAVREVREEIGCVPDTLWALPFVGSFYDVPSDTLQLCAAFGGILSTHFVQLSAEHSAYEWLLLEDAVQRLPMPSHQEGTRCFYQHILSTPFDSVPFPRFSPSQL